MKKASLKHDSCTQGDACRDQGEILHDDALWLAERLGSGDGERKTLLTRQIAFEPLPASVLFALGWPMDCSRVMLMIGS